MKSTLLNILRGHWALNPDWVAGNLPFIANLLRGESEMEMPEREISQEAKLVLLGSARSGATPLYKVGFYTDLSTLPQGSTVIIDVIGAITKYSGFCNYGSMELAELTNKIGACDNIDTIIYNIDSPGGHFNGTSTFAQAIEASSKLTIALINDGYAASAGYFIASACDYIYCAQATDQVGSIGVLCSFADYSEYFAKQGIKVHEIYAPQSSDKNKDVLDAFAGNPDAIKAGLKILAAAFIDAVKQNRGDRLDGDQWATGKMYYAPDAEKLGLIDGVKQLPEIMTMIKSGAFATGDNNSAYNKTINMFGNKLKKTYGLRGQAAAEISPEDLQAANEELHANGIDKELTLQRTTSDGPTAAELASANEALEDATAQLDATKLQLATSNKKVAQLTKDLAAANAKPGGYYAGKKTEQEDEDISEDPDPEDAELNNLEHNQKADAMFGWTAAQRK